MMVEFHLLIDSCQRHEEIRDSTSSSPTIKRLLFSTCLNCQLFLPLHPASYFLVINFFFYLVPLYFIFFFSLILQNRHSTTTEKSHWQHLLTIFEERVDVFCNYTSNLSISARQCYRGTPLSLFTFNPIWTGIIEVSLNDRSHMCRYLKKKKKANKKKNH